jgi:hypothetical protein
MPNIVSRNLDAFSIRDFDEVVCEMTRKTVSVPLEIAQPDFTLSRVTTAAPFPSDQSLHPALPVIFRALFCFLEAFFILGRKYRWL